MRSGRDLKTILSCRTWTYHLQCNFTMHPHPPQAAAKRTLEHAIVTIWTPIKSIKVMTSLSTCARIGQSANCSKFYLLEKASRAWCTGCPGQSEWSCVDSLPIPACTLSGLDTVEAQGQAVTEHLAFQDGRVTWKPWYWARMKIGYDARYSSKAALSVIGIVTDCMLPYKFYLSLWEPGAWIYKDKTWFR